MTNKEAVNWIINLTADIGKIQHQDLWHYEQALSEIREMLEAEPDRKKGRWIIHKDWLNEGFCGYECPNCGRCYDYPMNFCGFCGSPMEVENEC